MTVSDVAAPVAPRHRQLSRWWWPLVIVDGAALMTVAVGSLLVRYGTAGGWPFPPSDYLRTCAALAVAVIAVGLLTGLYTRPFRLPRPLPLLPLAARTVFLAVALLTMGDLVASPTWARLQSAPAALRALPYPTLNLVVFVAAAPVALTVVRRAALWARRRPGPVRLWLYGTAEDVDRFVTAAGRRPGHTVVGTGTDPGRVDPSTIDVLAVLDSTLVATLPPPLLQACWEHDRAILVAVSPHEASVGVSRIVPVGAWPFALLQPNGWPLHRQLAKWLLDRAVVVTLAPLWAPALMAAGLWTLAVAGRPVLFRQRRVGQGGRPFHVVKFRTMGVDAERDGPAMASVDDPRVLAGMRWMRETRVDELPQLLLVLAGRMSLVGPRPERDEFAGPVGVQVPLYRLRHVIPPGVTGLAQVRGSYATDLRAKLGFDLVYLANWSPVRDLEILVRTVAVMLTRRH